LERSARSEQRKDIDQIECESSARSEIVLIERFIRELAPVQPSIAHFVISLQFLLGSARVTDRLVAGALFRFVGDRN
jgi:hypothetical protein